MRLFLFLLLLALSNTGFSQDIEPHRWSQMPTGLNFFGLGLAYVEGDIFIDPLLLIEDASFELKVTAAAWVHSFGILGKSARVDVNLPYLSGRWQGAIDNSIVNIHRRGQGDARLRLSMLLYGGQAQRPIEFAQSKKSNTVIGTAISVLMPTGEYSKERLINLGKNQWVIRPQLGVTHRRGKWTTELTGSIFFYTNNNNFWKNTRLVTEPLVALQGHLIYSFRPGFWVSLSSGYGWGGEAKVNGVNKNNQTGNWLTALSIGYAINRHQGFKLSFIRGRTQRLTGTDSNRTQLAYSYMF